MAKCFVAFFVFFFVGDMLTLILLSIYLHRFEKLSIGSTALQIWTFFWANKIGNKDSPGFERQARHQNKI